MDEVGLDGIERLVSHHDEVTLVPIDAAHQSAEPRTLRQVRRRLGRDHVYVAFART